MNLILLILGILIAGGLLYWFPIRAWYRRSDARRLDARRAMSGDGEILSPTWESTLAINIDAPPASIWPLLVAMGYRRGGEYSYDSLDRLFGYLDAPGADRIYPQFQTFAGGDVIPVGRGAGFTARAIEPYRTLVLGGEQEHLRWSWQFELSPLAKGRTRLISRSRARVRPNLRSTVRTPLARLAAFVPDAAWVEQQLHFLIAEAESAFPGGNDVLVSSTGTNDEHPVPTAKMPSLAEHLQRVGPKGGLEHVIAAGYYLEHHTQVLGGFRRRDLVDAFRAVGYRHSNPGVPIGVARRRGLLMDGLEHEKLQLTESAERWVEERLLRAGLPAEPQDAGDI